MMTNPFTTTDTKLDYSQMSNKEVKVAVKKLIQCAKTADELRDLIKTNLQYPHYASVELGEHKKRAHVMMWDKDGKALFI